MNASILLGIIVSSFVFTGFVRESPEVDIHCVDQVSIAPIATTILLETARCVRSSIFVGCVYVGPIASTLGTVVGCIQMANSGNSQELLTYGTIGFAVTMCVIAILSLGIGLIGGVFCGIQTVLTSSRFAEIDDRIFPNQGIHRSFRNSIFYGSFTSLLTLVVVTPFFAIPWTIAAYLVDPSKAVNAVVGATLLVSIFAAIPCGLYFAGRAGGAASFRHFFLRFCLASFGLFPFRMVSFLQYANQRMLLRKVGGGFAFPHRIFLDYLASEACSEEAIAKK